MKTTARKMWGYYVLTPQLGSVVRVADTEAEARALGLPFYPKWPGPAHYCFAVTIMGVPAESPPVSDA